MSDMTRNRKILFGNEHNTSLQSGEINVGSHIVETPKTKIKVIRKSIKKKPGAQSMSTEQTKEIIN